MGQSDAVYSVTEATGSEILTKKADTERTAEVAPKDAKLNRGGMRVRACQELGDEEAVQPGGLFQNLSKFPGGSHKQILGSSAPWLGAAV